MTRDTCPEREKTPSDPYERKMARQRPPFLNQDTLNTVVRDHQAYLAELAVSTPVEKR